MTKNAPLVSTNWLASNLDNPDVIILDSSYHLPNTNRDAQTEFQSQRIPGARFFDFDGSIKDQDAAQPHMLPSSEVFKREVETLGVSNDSLVIAYDTLGIFSAARCWWMFRCFGHLNVAVLDGGFKKWALDQHPIETGAPSIEATKAQPTQFNATLNPSLVRSASQILKEKEGTLILDARAPGRFLGLEEEPRPGLRSGHIPGAQNVPFSSVLTEAGTLKSEHDLKTLFRDIGVSDDTPITASCGSGVTACVLALALSTLGRDDVAIYDGSWSEWGADHTLPIET